MDGQLQYPDWVLNKNVNRGPKERYPWSTVGVGESFVVPVGEQTCQYASFKVMAHARGRKLGRKFHTRVRPEDGAFEVWRER